MNSKSGMENRVVIVADGTFPHHRVPLGFLADAAKIICCDGSAEILLGAGYVPDAIVGDMDSLGPGIAGRFPDRIFRDDDQETNDLTKAVKWCILNNFRKLVILGATGKREDHTIGNISLLVEYAKDADVIMVTDTGIFKPLAQSSVLPCFPGQQVSLFSIDQNVEITSTGLKYPLKRKKLDNWWMATLNEAEGEEFSLEFQVGRIIVYQKFRD